LLAVTVDIRTKERLVLRRGRIADAVHASCAMPGIVAPVKINGHLCVDGGVIDPVPVGALRKYSDVDRVLAVSVIPTFEDVDEGRCVDEDDDGMRLAWWRRIGWILNDRLNFLAPGNMIDTFRQSIRAAQIRMACESCKRADLCLRPKLKQAPWHDYAGFRGYIDAGRAVALENLDAIRELTQPDRQTHENPQPESMVGNFVA
jgi:NTE family protein